MTKRISAKHKIDRRLKINLWGRPKSPFNKRDYGQDSMVKAEKENHLIMEFSYKLSKN